jgi:hypothetical protein
MEKRDFTMWLGWRVKDSLWNIEGATTLACEPREESPRAESRDLESLEPRIHLNFENYTNFRI